MGDMMGHMDAMMGASLWGGAMILVLLMVAGGVAVGVVAVKATGRQRSALTAKPAADDEALRILRQRYARSEIDEDEFLRRQSALTPY